MQLRYAFFLTLTFIAGLLVGRYYLPWQAGQSGTSPLKEPAPVERRGESPAKRPGEQRAPLRRTRSETSSWIPERAGQGQGAVRRVLPATEHLRREYANVLRELGLSEADVEGMVESLAPPDPHAWETAGDVETGIPATPPTPQELALEFEKTLVESGIAPEEARVAADDFIEQMLATSATPDGGPDPLLNNSPGGSPAPPNDSGAKPGGLREPR